MERHLGRGWVPALASLTRITCEILLCTHLTLPTVWHLLTTSSSATLLISYSSRLTTPPSLAFFLLACSLAYASFLTHAIRLLQFPLSCALSCCTPPPFTFSLSVVAPQGKPRYVNCFLPDVSQAYCLFILSCKHVNASCS